MTWTTALLAVVGASHRLRDDRLAEVLSTWSGPVKRHVEPGDLARICLDLSTASLFEDPACHVIRAGTDYLRHHKDALRDLAGQPLAGGALVLVCDPPKAKNDALFAAIGRAGGLHLVDEPNPKVLADWLAARAAAHPQGCSDARKVAYALIDHLGTEVDALLGTLDVMAVLCGDRPIDVAAVSALYDTDAAKPLYLFADAVLSARADEALRQLHALGADHPERVLAALIGDLRKVLACAETDDDAEAARLAGLFGRPNLYHPRQRARRLGKALLQRILRGAVLAQRGMRSGSDPLLQLETLVLHARGILAAASR